MNSSRVTHRIHTRPPRGGAVSAQLCTDAAALEAVMRDAASYPGGRVDALASPRNEAEVATVLATSERVLPIGSQSSVTGGATPMGEVVLSLSRMDTICGIEGDVVRAQAGVVLSDLQRFLRERGAYFPPVPAYEGPQVGGAVSTNAAGPATFKYGSTRRWVRGLTVVLSSGEVLDIERGQCIAHPDGYFEVQGPRGSRRVPVPTYSMPTVEKCSAGYHATPNMDLVDLFVGSEGTLGVITEVSLQVVRPCPLVALALVTCPNEAAALELADELRDEGLKARRARNGDSIDVSAVEFFDRRSLELLREDGREHRAGVSLEGVHAALLALIELSDEDSNGSRADPAVRVDGYGVTRWPPSGLVRLLERRGMLEGSLLIAPDNRERIRELISLREAVPEAVNARVRKLEQETGAGVTKVGADMVVPFARLWEMIRAFREGFDRRGLDHAIWGHASDGNLHPNLIPHAPEDIPLAKEVVVEVGQAVIRLGGCPLAEHGVGRNPVKQRLLEALYGRRGIEQMHAVKSALDPGWKLAPGNLFAGRPQVVAVPTPQEPQPGKEP